MERRIAGLGRKPGVFLNEAGLNIAVHPAALRFTRTNLNERPGILPGENLYLRAGEKAAQRARVGTRLRAQVNRRGGVIRMQERARRSFILSGAAGGKADDGIRGEKAVGIRSAVIYVHPRIADIAENIAEHAVAESRDGVRRAVRLRVKRHGTIGRVAADKRAGQRGFDRLFAEVIAEHIALDGAVTFADAHVAKAVFPAEQRGHGAVVKAPERIRTLARAAAQMQPVGGNGIADVYALCLSERGGGKACEQQQKEKDTLNFLHGESLLSGYLPIKRAGKGIPSRRRKIMLFFLQHAFLVRSEKGSGDESPGWGVGG